VYVYIYIDIDIFEKSSAKSVLSIYQIKSILFWQWANQSVNVAFNSANANKTTPMSLKETGSEF
jgi:hypothetical protein